MRAREEKEEGRGKDEATQLTPRLAIHPRAARSSRGNERRRGGDGGVVWDRALVRPGWQADERAADGARAIPGPERPGETTGAAPPSPAAARAS